VPSQRFDLALDVGNAKLRLLTRLEGSTVVFLTEPPRLTFDVTPPVFSSKQSYGTIRQGEPLRRCALTANDSARRTLRLAPSPCAKGSQVGCLLTRTPGVGASWTVGCASVRECHPIGPGSTEWDEATTLAMSPEPRG
jgi:hypothetical protein